MILIDIINDNITLIVTILVISSVFLVDLFLKRKIKKIKNELNNKYSEEEIDEINNLEQDIYIEYYKEINKIHLARLLIVIVIISGLLIYKVPSLFSFLAIAIGAIIIAFKEAISSFIGFFYTSTNYKIGDGLVMNEGKIRGEIIYLNILNIGLVGKDENGEHNGEFYIIPNYKLLIEYIHREDISLHKYKKEIIDIWFNKEDYKNINFNDFIVEMKKYLDENLDRLTIKNVGNYKTFIGHRYKLRYEMKENNMLVKVYIVIKPRDFIKFNERFILHIESIKQKKS